MKTWYLSIVLLLAAQALVARPAGGKFVTGYYPIWSYCSMSPSDVDFTAITHLIVFTADPDTSVYPYFGPVTTPTDSSSLEWGTPNPNCTPQGKWGKPSGYSYYRWLTDSAHAHGAKVLLCLGGIYGAGRDKMAWIAKDSVKTQAWAEAAVSYIQRKGMDGVDLDWEYPSGSGSGYMRMLRILRRQLDAMTPPGLLTIAAPAWTNNAAYDYATIGTIVDQINIMSYDFSGGSSAWFNAGLGNNTVDYPNVGPTAGSSSWWNWNNHGARQWLAKGVPASRISMGIPFYSWRFSGPTAVTQPIVNRWYGTYAEAIAKIAQFGAGIYHWDDSAKAPYLTYNENGTNYFITYDDTNSVAAKTAWCNDLDLGGVMIYELWSGWVSSAPAGRRDPLLQAVKRVMGGSVTQPPPPTPAAPVQQTPANAASGLSTDLTLGWSAAAGATSYRAQVSGSSTFTTLVADRTGLAGTSVALGGLAPGTQYFWRVNASNASGTGAWSPAWSFTTAAPAQPPAAPSPVSPPDGASDVALPATISWGAVSGAATYRAQLSLSPGFDSVEVDQAGLGATSLVLPALGYSMVYFWRVSAANTAGAGAWSRVNSFTTAEPSPPPPPAQGDSIPAPALLRDDFNRPDGPLPGSNRWSAPANFPGGGTLAVASGVVQAATGAGLGTTGAVVWDSLMSGGAEESFTLRQKSGDGSAPTLSLYARMSGKDYATAAGYRLDVRDQAGTDRLELRRAAAGMATTTLIAGGAFELAPGDVITFRVLGDNRTMIGLVNGIEVVRCADTVVAAATWFFGAASTVFATPARFDDFRVSPTPPLVPLVRANRTSIAYGKVVIGSAKRDSVLLTNTGTADLAVTAAATDAPQFSVSAPAGAIPPGATATVYIDFRPDGRTSYSGSVNVTLNDGALGRAVAVSGRGVAPARVRHSSARISFGALAPESSATRPIVLYNDGDLALAVTGAVTTNAAFSVTPETATIAPADSAVFTVRARPADAAAAEGYVVFSYDAQPASDSVGVRLESAGAPPPGGTPASFALAQNYPNPFNPSTTIAFTLAEPSTVSVRVYDPLGREVATLLAGEVVGAGTREVVFDASRITSGVYFYRLSAVPTDPDGGARGVSAVRKMLLVR